MMLCRVCILSHPNFEGLSISLIKPPPPCSANLQTDLSREAPSRDLWPVPLPSLNLSRPSLASPVSVPFVEEEQKTNGDIGTERKVLNLPRFSVPAVVSTPFAHQMLCRISPRSWEPWPW